MPQTLKLRSGEVEAQRCSTTDLPSPLCGRDWGAGSSVEFLLSTLETTRVSAQENLQSTPAAPWSARKKAIAEVADRIAPERARWIARNAYYYRTDREYMRFLIPEGARVLDVGCRTGDLLAALKPSIGLGTHLSQKMVKIAREVHPELEFRAGDVEDPGFVATLPGPFDFIVLS